MTRETLQAMKLHQLRESVAQTRAEIERVALEFQALKDMLVALCVEEKEVLAALVEATSEQAP